MRPVFVVLALGIANIVGCGSTAPDADDFNLAPGAPPPVVTDAELYTLTKVSGGYDAVAQAVYTNTTGRLVYYQRCTSELSGPMYGVRRTGADSAADALGRRRVGLRRRRAHRPPPARRVAPSGGLAGQHGLTQRPATHQARGPRRPVPDRVPVVLELRERFRQLHAPAPAGPPVQCVRAAIAGGRRAGIVDAAGVVAGVGTSGLRYIRYAGANRRPCAPGGSGTTNRFGQRIVRGGRIGAGADVAVPEAGGGIRPPALLSPTRSSAARERTGRARKASDFPRSGRCRRGRRRSSREANDARREGDGAAAQRTMQPAKAQRTMHAEGDDSP